MADPATIALVAKAAITAATDKRTWKAAGIILSTVLTPFILIVIMITGILSGTAEHNNSAIQLAFHGGAISGHVPVDYQGHIKEMQDSFSRLDDAISKLIPIMEGSLDPIQAKAIFYSLYFGSDSQAGIEYQTFIDSFVRYEERTRTITDSRGKETTVTYTVAVPLTSLAEIYGKLEKTMSLKITYEDQANATEIYYRILYNTDAPKEGDGFEGWMDWIPEQLAGVEDIPAAGSGAKAVQLALSRLGDPYSQELRGQEGYTDCSYLVLWTYRQLGVKLPGTAAEQARYCVSKGSAVPGSSLAPGDLVFWSYGPNGRYLNITHVGIYCGNGMVVDASSSKGKVVYRKIYDVDKQVMYARPYANGKK